MSARASRSFDGYWAAVRRRGIKDLLVQTYGPRCRYCLVETVEVPGERARLRTRAWRTVDHVTPICQGGDEEADNLVLSCRGCNEDKREQSLSEWIRATHLADVASRTYWYESGPRPAYMEQWVSGPNRGRIIETSLDRLGVARG